MHQPNNDVFIISKIEAGQHKAALTITTWVKEFSARCGFKCLCSFLKLFESKPDKYLHQIIPQNKIQYNTRSLSGV